jgi:pimeloyl-ACP methyl ester carboxylesterase
LGSGAPPGFDLSTEEEPGERSGDRDVLVIGGDLGGAAAALAAVRSGARTRLLVHGGQPPESVPEIPENPVPEAREQAKRLDVPAPEEPTVFGFRSRRVRRWLDELGIQNDEAWAENLQDAILDRLSREGAAVDETTVAVRLIGDAEDGVSGAVLVDGEDCTTHTADTTILAGGGSRFLWPVEDKRQPSPPSGIALALRAELPIGNLGRVVWEDETPFRFVDGLRGDGRGHCDVPGVAACGEALANPWYGVDELAYLEDVVRGLEAGGFQGPPAGSGDPELVPLVDNPMPTGFARVKMERLRATVGRQLGPDATQEDIEEGHAALLSLRGEFADYARARAETDLHVLYQAADVALAHADARLDE